MRNSLILLSGLFLLMQIKPSAQITPPQFVFCSNGGLVYMDAFTGSTTKPVYHCVDPQTLKGQQGPQGLTGPQGPQGPQGPAGPQGSPDSSILSMVPCSPPTAGVQVFAVAIQNLDGSNVSCLNLVAVPASGVAGNWIPTFGIANGTWLPGSPDFPYPIGRKQGVSNQVFQFFAYNQKAAQ